MIPTPLEIGSPGGTGDILSLACLGSYRAVSQVKYIYFSSLFACALTTDRDMVGTLDLPQRRVSGISYLVQ